MDIVTEGSKDILMAPYGDMFKFQRKIASVAIRYVCQHIIHNHTISCLHMFFTEIVLLQFGQETSRIVMGRAHTTKNGQWINSLMNVFGAREPMISHFHWGFF